MAVNELEPLATAGGGRLRALVIVVVVLVALLGACLVAPRFPGVRKGLERIVRCSDGHLFVTLWWPLGSFKAVRLGGRRYQRCPVGRHWTIVVRVDPATLSPEETAAARSHRDVLLI